MSAAATSMTSGTVLRPGSARGTDSRKRRAEAPHRTRRATRPPWRAPRRAEIHERLIEVVSAPAGHERLSQRPQPGFAAQPLEPSRPEEHAAEHAAHIRIEHGRIPPERE